MDEEKSEKRRRTDEGDAIHRHHSTKDYLITLREVRQARCRGLSSRERDRDRTDRELLVPSLNVAVFVGQQQNKEESEGTGITHRERY